MLTRNSRTRRTGCWSSGNARKHCISFNPPQLKKSSRDVELLRSDGRQLMQSSRTFSQMSFSATFASWLKQPLSPLLTGETLRSPLKDPFFCFQSELHHPLALLSRIFWSGSAISSVKTPSPRKIQGRTTIRNSSSLRNFDPRVARVLSDFMTSTATAVSFEDNNTQYCERQVQLGLSSLFKSLRRPATLTSLAEKPLSLLPGLCFIDLKREPCIFLEWWGCVVTSNMPSTTSTSLSTSWLITLRVTLWTSLGWSINLETVKKCKSFILIPRHEKNVIEAAVQFVLT